ncbi:hypothetical protein, partial [Providencia rustigianii]|uniref:hypothetical protein n=1 Tax=Providencia rustigianii TaxID=158850 RepID=UPI00224039FB
PLRLPGEMYERAGKVRARYQLTSSLELLTLKLKRSVGSWGAYLYSIIKVSCLIKADQSSPILGMGKPSLLCAYSCPIIDVL